MHVTPGNRILILIFVLTCEQSSPLDDYAGLVVLCQELRLARSLRNICFILGMLASISILDLGYWRHSFQIRVTLQ